MELKVKALQSPQHTHNSTTMSWEPSYSLVVDYNGIDVWIFVNELTVAKIRKAVEDKLEEMHKNKLLIDEVNRMLKEEE